MSYPTQPAFIHHGPWDSETRSHPAMKWMETYTSSIIDSRAWSTTTWDKWLTSDFVISKADGTTVKGGEAAWTTLQEIYGPFTANFHQPHFVVCFETEQGWTMIGQANLFVNLVGEKSEGEEKVKDDAGKEWDVRLPSAFVFDYRKSGDDIRLSRGEINGDTLPAVQILMKRGVIKG